jgi:flagellar protein FlaG
MIKKVLEELDVNNIDINVGFKMRDDFKEPIIEVVDKDTKKVIRQIPTEEFITRVNNSDNLKGMLFDDKF